VSSCYKLGFLLLLLIIGLPQTLWAQQFSDMLIAPDSVDSFTLMPSDTIPEKIPKLFSHRRLVVQYDSRYSIINKDLCTINGLKLGMEWKGRVRTGAAVYFLSTGIPTRQAPPNNAAVEADAELRFRYVALYSEYIILQNVRWSLSGNLQTGLGSVYVHYLTETGNYDKTRSDFLGIVEPSAAAQMRLFHWAALGAGAGWRQPVLVAKSIRHELGGPVFYVRANLLLGPLFKVIKGRERLFTQKGLRWRGIDAYTRSKFYGQ
jgi:hypothetical protein